MEFILDVLGKLSIDQTFIIQFILVLIFYFLIKTLLISKVQYVIELRDSKTTKMEDHANKKFQEADKLAEKFKEETEKAYVQAQEMFAAKKSEIVTREKNRYKAVEAEVSQKVDEEKKAFEGEIAQHRQKVMEGADQLSKDLVNRIIQ